MPNKEQLNQSIDKVIAAIMEMKTLINEETVTPLAASVEPTEEMSEFESLKAALQSDKWPEAVNPNLICQPDVESDKLERGRGIIELLVEENIQGLKVLDYGCGEGHCSYVASQSNAEISVGFDVKPYENWNGFVADNLLYTTSLDEVAAKGPYDVIILYDVLDHVENETATSVLKNIRSLLKDDGKAYVRCHPFISRHGTHLYHQLNKAYVHLVFSPDELKALLPQVTHTANLRVIYPIRTYTELAESTGLKIQSRREVTEAVEPFFKTPKIGFRIMKHTGSGTFPEFQMGIQFVDMQLVKG